MSSVVGHYELQLSSVRGVLSRSTLIESGGLFSSSVLSSEILNILFEILKAANASTLEAESRPVSVTHTDVVRTPQRGLQATTAFPRRLEGKALKRKYNQSNAAQSRI